MLDTITLMMKQGKLKEAVEQLHLFVQELDLDPEIESSIVVLSGNISDVIKQEKRRRISTRKAMDLKTTYAWELEDIVSELRSSHPQVRDPATVDSASTPDTPAPVRAQPDAANNKPLNNEVHVTVNVNIENHITTEIKNNIFGLSEGLNEFKQELRNVVDQPEAEAALREVEELEQDMQAMKEAKDKEDLPPMLKKVESFLKRIEDGNDYLAKAFKLTKQGAQTLQKVGRNYNSIAQWAGLPQIPGVFL